MNILSSGLLEENNGEVWCTKLWPLVSGENLVEAVYCSVLQVLYSEAVCCSVLQCFAINRNPMSNIQVKVALMSAFLFTSH